MTSIPPLFAFGFGNALMLGWLAVAAAPILIHLWNKRKYREVPWAAIEYLLAALRKNARRIQLEQWLLLAVRTLLIVLVVMAVAQPFLEKLGLNFIAGERTLKVLVIDGSFSMAYQPTDKTLFARAKQLAVQIVEESSQGDGFTLVLMGSPPTVIVGTPAVEARDFLEEIENLKQPHGGGDLPATLAKVEEILKKAEGSGLVRKEVYFLTDLGRTTWLPDAGDESRRNSAEPSPAAATSETTPSAAPAADGDFRRRVEQLAGLASLVVIDLGQNSSENMAITSLRVADPFTTVARDVTFETQVQNFGSQPREHHLVEFYIDGRRMKETHVNVPAGQSVPVVFSYRFENPGEHVVEARLGSDLLDIDNHRYLALDVKQFVRVLCVSGKSSSSGLNGATDYLVFALNPDEGSSTQRGTVEPEVIPESALLERDLSRYDAVFLCNVGQFTANEARVLRSYVSGGGGLVFFLGDQVLSERYNRELGAEAGGVRVLPALLGKLVDASETHFDPLAYRHPLVSAFKGREQAGLLTTPVYKYFRLELPPKSGAKVALEFEGGAPAIVEETIGRGRSILVATEGSFSSLDPITKTPWTNLPAWPSYVPIVQELLALAVSGQTGEHNVMVGQAIGDTVSVSATQAPLALRTADGRQEQLRLTVDAEGSRWAFGDTNYSGVYTASLGPPVARDKTFCVNVDTTESDLARIDPAELPKQFTTNRQANLDQQAAANVSRHSGLHRGLLYCVLGLLFLETFLAWRFGHPTS